MIEIDAHDRAAFVLRSFEGITAKLDLCKATPPGIWARRHAADGVDDFSRNLPQEHGDQDNVEAKVSRPKLFSARGKLRVVGIRALRTSRVVQDRLVRLLGSSVEGRAEVAAGMLARNANETTSYWLQLVVATGIATLGLVVGSTAVIIGAMLVAPLMGPIVALAMGLATGSPFLVLRSAARIVFSVLVAIGGAALIAVLVPFRELNAEIAARTSPTVLDLLTAGFCALAGVYASLRPGSDTAATAAGTSIGISLVPPLCASGYGLGTGMWTVAGGAALLFLTNIVAIIFVGTVSFVAAGFNRVDTVDLERVELAKDQRAVFTAAIARRLAVLFESNAGPLLRFLMPILLLAAVYIPLRRALDEVAWEVRVRAAVQAALAREQSEVVQSRVRVERHQVDVRLVLLGTTEQAAASRARLDEKLSEVAGVVPHIEVVAIPDATAFAGLASTMRISQEARSSPILDPAEQLDEARKLIRSNVSRLWPAAAAGDPLTIDVGTNPTGPLRVRIVHLGPALGADGAESLGRSLGTMLNREIELIDVALPTEPLTRSDGDLKFATRVAEGVRSSGSIDDVHVCVVEPRPPDRRRRASASEREMAEALRDVLSLHPRVTTELGDEWQVRFVRGECSRAVAGDAAVGEAAASR
jgi:uncharacterized hydrophobic protein (TIGR00271 family)